MTADSLDQLKSCGTVVVSDSGDFECKSVPSTPIDLPRSSLKFEFTAIGVYKPQVYPDLYRFINKN